MTGIQAILTIVAIGATSAPLAQRFEKDTILILKHKAECELPAIFIDSNTNSKFYGPISNFDFSYTDSDNYKVSIVGLKQQYPALQKVKPVIPWYNWVTLKQYQDQFYVYSPCDFLYHLRQSVNDTTFIDWTGEGPVANKIISQKKIDDDTYQFILTGIQGLERSIIIYIIDRKKGIAVFEQSNKGKGTTYNLMIAADKIKSVPIIINHCPVQKKPEFNFDEPDFKRLLTKNDR